MHMHLYVYIHIYTFCVNKTMQFIKNLISCNTGKYAVIGDEMMKIKMMMISNHNFILPKRKEKINSMNE